MDPLLLTDSTMPMNFCGAGIGCARSMASFLDSRVHMVRDVHEELERKAERLPALKSLLEVWPATPLRELDQNLKADAAAAMKARRAPGEHSDEDRGETATVFYAASCRDLGEEAFTVVTDDSYGKRLARDRGFEILTTPVLALQMICAEALSEADGKRVWQQATGRQRWKDFDSALTRERAAV